MGNAAEIIGKVQEDLMVKCFQATDFGTNFGKFRMSMGFLLLVACVDFLVGADYAAADAVVECTHRHKRIFYDAGDE